MLRPILFLTLPDLKIVCHGAFRLAASLCISGLSGFARRVVHPVVYRQVELYLYDRAAFTVNVDGERFKVSCVVEGVGTNLFGYRVYMSKRLRIPLSELKFRSVKAEDGEKFLKIDSLSLHNAISVRLSDIKVISVGSVPEIPDPRQQEK